MEAYGSFAKVYDLFMDNVPYELWGEHLQSLLKQYGVGEGLVAELGCGTGRMTRILAEAGYDMIGIDSSCEMLEEAYGAGSGGILYLNQDMRSFELYGTVAAVVSVCDSMNYITEERDLLQVFSLANNYLDPGGVFIFDMNTPFKYRQILADHVFAENRPEGSFIWENYFDEDTGINEYDLTLYIREGGNPAGEPLDEETGEDGWEYGEVGGSARYGRFEETHFQRAYEPRLVRDLLERAGLEFVGMLDADTMEEPKKDAQRIYFIARECTKKG